MYFGHWLKQTYFLQLLYNITGTNILKSKVKLGYIIVRSKA